MLRVGLSVRGNKFNTPARTCPARVVCKASAVEGSKATGSGLYLLHWRSKPQSDVENTKETLEALRNDLKMMEKVAKECVWYTTSDSSDGHDIIMLTDSMKLAEKYSLTEVTPENHVVTVSGGAMVTVPLAPISPATTGSDAEELSSMAEDEEEATMKEKKKKDKVKEDEKKGVKMGKADKGADSDSDSDDDEEDVKKVKKKMDKRDKEDVVEKKMKKEKVEKGDKEKLDKMDTMAA